MNRHIISPACASAIDELCRSRSYQDLHVIAAARTTREHGQGRSGLNEHGHGIATSATSEQMRLELGTETIRGEQGEDRT
jgi:hypothetical protein